jgi:hypothetical protein
VPTNQRARLSRLGFWRSQNRDDRGRKGIAIIGKASLMENTSILAIPTTPPAAPASIAMYWALSNIQTQLCKQVAASSSR